jgi:DNA-binding beta-propeller fold protein YncE
MSGFRFQSKSFSTRRSLPIVVLVALVCAPGGRGPVAQEMAPLVLERTVALKGVSGRIDHMATDLGRKRLFVAELGNGTLDVIDLAMGAVIRRIENLKEPQGVAYAPRADILAVASAGDGSVRLFHGADLSPAGIIDLGDDADNIRLDSRTGNLVVGYGSGGLAVIDPAKAEAISRIRLQAHPEGFQLDPSAGRAFVNVPEAQQIAVVDFATGKQIASWPVPELRANFPMAREDTGATLAAIFRSPARLVLLDAQSGSVRMNMQTCGDADDVFFDAKRKRIYVSCGDGRVDVFGQDANGYRSIVQTATGARTSLFVPELDRLFVASRAGFFGRGSDAAILVFRPQP